MVYKRHVLLHGAVTVTPCGVCSGTHSCKQATVSEVVSKVGHKRRNLCVPVTMRHVHTVPTWPHQSPQAPTGTIEVGTLRILCCESAVCPWSPPKRGRKGEQRLQHPRASLCASAARAHRLCPCLPFFDVELVHQPIWAFSLHRWRTRHRPPMATVALQWSAVLFAAGGPAGGTLQLQPRERVSSGQSTPKR